MQPLKLFMILTAVVVFNSNAFAEDAPFPAPKLTVTPAPAPVAPPVVSPLLPTGQIPKVVEKKPSFFANVFAVYDMGTTINSNGNASANGKSISFNDQVNTSSTPGLGLSAEWNSELTQIHPVIVAKTNKQCRTSRLSIPSMRIPFPIARKFSWTLNIRS